MEFVRGFSATHHLGCRLSLRHAAVPIWSLVVSAQPGRSMRSQLSNSDSQSTRPSNYSADGFETPLDRDIVEDLDERTKGWIASLQLFYGSIRGRPPTAIRSMARALSGASGPIYDFLAEEILGSVSADLRQFLTRCSILTMIDPVTASALLTDHEDDAVALAGHWIDEAERLALLGRSTSAGDTRQLHPLLRDFLLEQLRRREGPEAVKELHAHVARATAKRDPLTAAHHFVEASAHDEAMKYLGASLMLTIGSGRWGVASQLLSRVEGIPTDPAVATIRARQLLQEGELSQATMLLASVDISEVSPDIRAVFRHTMVLLAWRSGDREKMFRALEDIERDTETPPMLREMAEVMLDASPLTSPPKTLIAIARRLRDMAQTPWPTRI